MTYELALELKNAGFPQKDTIKGWRLHKQGTPKDGSYENYHHISCPTLSELIEACGEDFTSLHSPKFANPTWIANGKYDPYIQGEGSTHEEAVARLWLSLKRG